MFYAFHSTIIFFHIKRENKKAFAQGLLSYGGAERDRTADLLLARQALSQLSYSPYSWKNALSKLNRINVYVLLKCDSIERR